MISSGAYNYINVLEKTCDASWTRNSLISNNIANVDTPNYKRKDLKFEEYLSSAVTLGSSLDEDIANVDLDTLTGIHLYRHMAMLIIVWTVIMSTLIRKVRNWLRTRSNIIQC